MKKKVIFFMPSRCGGAERVSVTISKCLPDSDFDVSYHLFGDIDQMSAFLPKNRKKKWHKCLRHTDAFISKARSIIIQEKPNVVFASLMPLNWRLVLAAFGQKCKVVLRSDNYIETQSLSQKVRLAFAYHFADSIIVQTDEMKKGIVSKLFVPSSKVQVLANPIDTEYINMCVLNGKNPYSSTALKIFRFVAVGRFDYVKGFDILVRAFRLVKEKLPNSELHILGQYCDGDVYFKKVREMIEDEEIGNSVVFEGFQKNPYVYMKNADCYVLSSRNEGLPNVLIESLFLGTPVAATACVPVISRIVQEGKNGFLAEPENEQELAGAMLKASKLGRIASGYSASSKESFLKIFK